MIHRVVGVEVVACNLFHSHCNAHCVFPSARVVIYGLCMCVCVCVSSERYGKKDPLDADYDPVSFPGTMEYTESPRRLSNSSRRGQLRPSENKKFYFIYF